MRRTRTLTACLGVFLLLTLTASVARADRFSADDMGVKAKSNEGHHLNLSDEGRAGTISLFAEFFENNNGLHLGLLKNDNGLHLGLLKNHADELEFENNNNQGEFEQNSGKHLGFTMARTNPGNKFGLFKGPQSPSPTADTIPNPEPAAIFLLGTGLAAAGAFARRRFRKSAD